MRCYFESGDISVYSGSLADEIDILCITLFFTFIVKGPSVSIS